MAVVRCQPFVMETPISQEDVPVACPSVPVWNLQPGMADATEFDSWEEKVEEDLENLGGEVGEVARIVGRGDSGKLALQSHEFVHDGIGEVVSLPVTLFG